MNSDQQIDEMARDLCEHYGTSGCDTENCECYRWCNIYSDCSVLHKKGYRKSEDVAREIVEDAKETILNYHLQENKKYLKGLSKTKKQFDIETACFRAITDAVKFAIATLNEIEKKYTEEEKR